MNEILIIGLCITAIFSVVSSVLLLRVGIRIDQHPSPDDGERKRSLASPIETTRICVGLYWVFFFLGVLALLEGSRTFMILGITAFIAIVVFMITVLIFSFSVLGIMQRRKKGQGSPAPAGSPAAAAGTSKNPAEKAGRKGRAFARTYRPPGSAFIEKLFRRG